MRTSLSMITLVVLQILMITMTVLHRNRESRPTTGAVPTPCAIMFQTEADPMATMTVGSRTNIPRIRKGMMHIEAMVHGAEVHPSESIPPVGGMTMALQPQQTTN